MIVGIMSGAVINNAGFACTEEALRQIHYTGSSIGLDMLCLSSWSCWNYFINGTYTCFIPNQT